MLYAFIAHTSLHISYSCVCVYTLVPNSGLSFRKSNFKVEVVSATYCILARVFPVLSLRLCYTATIDGIYLITLAFSNI